MADGDRQAAGRAALRAAHAAVLQIGLNPLRDEIEALARRARGWTSTCPRTRRSPRGPTIPPRAWA
jgi:hypothetical protein